MSGLTIRRLSADIVSSELSDRDRVDRLLRRIAGGGLDERRAGMHGLSGDWCVRRLEVELRLDSAEPDASATDRWADLIAASVRALVPDGSSVIHYPNRSHALYELVTSLVGGRSDRAWAWRQVRLLEDHDPDPNVDPSAALLAALSREPELALAAMIRTVRAAGLVAVHRLLGEAGWVRLATNVAADSYATAATGQVSARPAIGRDPSPSMTVQADTRARAAAVLSDSVLAFGCLSSGMDPSPVVLKAWAVLCTAEVEPYRPQLADAVSAELVRRLSARRQEPQPEGAKLPSRTDADNDPAALALPGSRADRLIASPDRTEHAAAEPAEDEPAVSQPTRHAPSYAGQDPVSAVAAAGLGAPLDGPGFAESTDAALVPLTGQASEDNRVGTDTAWAGLPFLLNTAGLAGLPDAIEDDHRLTGRSLRWTVHQLGQRLVPVRAADAAALALAGLPPVAPCPAGPAATDAEDVALAEHAGRWADVTHEAVLLAARPGDDSTLTVWSLARRAGRVVADPGWLEVHLDLDTVDVQVRRAGLDVDPGWIRWLGTVVRFCYD